MQRLGPRFSALPLTKVQRCPGEFTRPSQHRLLLGLARYATTTSHRLMRGPHRSKAAKGGLGENPRGKRLATDKRHRVDTGQEAKGLSLFIGGKERVAGVRQFNGDRNDQRNESGAFPNRSAQHGDRMMRYFFDTEFIEDGKTIELVSIGIIAEDGREYYREVAGVDKSRADPWLHENVFPHLTGDEAPREQIAREVVEFAGDAPEFWAYYADYDWVVLCQLHGRMIDLPNGWPMYCRDLKQRLDEAGNPRIPIVNASDHHALADARWAKAAFDWLEASNA